MDYLKLKQTLLAAFDHFLSCHDMDELEVMMQGLENGKKLVIQFPEPIHRDDYNDDVMALNASKPKRITSRIKAKKKTPREIVTQQEACLEVPVYMQFGDLKACDQKQIKDLLKTEPTVKIKQPMVMGNKVLAMAEFKTEKKIIVTKTIAPEVGVRDTGAHRHNAFDQNDYAYDAGDDAYRKELIKKVKELILEQRKQEKPP